MDPRLLELAIQAMTPAAFEDLVFALVRAEEQTARQLNPPDAGRDTIVPATDEQRERAWQAKHHVSGIAWGKCEESLKRALEERDPETVTFVFPVNMTEGKEEGLGDLRRRYPEVDLPEPWTLGTLREKLADASDIRRHHIDRVIGVDQEYALKMLSRGAALRERWEEQTAAALLGPLAALGLDDDAAAANDALEREDWLEASQRFEAMAAATADRMPAVADAMLLNAARTAAEGEDRPRSGDLYLQASRNAAARGDAVAEYAAFRASWNLPEEERWRSAAATARAAWLEQPEESVPILRDAFDHALEGGDPEQILEWATAACDALAAEDAWRSVLEIAEAATTVLDPVLDDGERLDLELDLITARSELGETVEPSWKELALSPIGANDSAAGRIHARWGMACARRGEVEEASRHFREAVARWRLAGDSEEEIAEMLLAEDVLAQLLGGKTLDQAGRIAIAELRGRRMTPTVLADRKETEGLRAWLAERGWDARRSLSTSWAIHRRAGHLAGCLRLAETLLHLFERAEEREQALAWAIRCGKQNIAKEIAQKLEWEAVLRRVQVEGAPWERGASFEAIATKGATASDTEIESLLPNVLEAAQDHESNEHWTLQPGPAARRALATLLCGIGHEHFEQALAEVVFEIKHTPFPPAVCINGLLLACELSLCQETKLIAEVYSSTGRAHLPGFSAAVKLVRNSPEAAEVAAERAGESSLDALILCAWADLPEERPELAERAAEVVSQSLEGAQDPNERLLANDRGCLARWSSSEDQLAVANDLLNSLVSPSEFGTHRYEAAIGLATLAERMPPEAAAATLDLMLESMEAVGTPSAIEGTQSHPNALFARVKLRAPAESEQVEAAALRAAVELAVRAGREEDTRELVAAGLADSRPAVRSAAARCSVDRPDIAQLDVRELAGDDDPTIRAIGLTALAKRHELTPEDQPLLSACTEDQPLALRTTALHIAQKEPNSYATALEILSSDPHVFIRRGAQLAAAA